MFTNQWTVQLQFSSNYRESIELSEFALRIGLRGMTANFRTSHFIIQYNSQHEYFRQLPMFYQLNVSVPDTKD